MPAHVPYFKWPRGGLRNPPQLPWVFDGVSLESLPGTPLQVAVWWSGKPSPAALMEFTRTVNQILTRNPSPCGYKMVLETMVSYASEVHPRISTGDNMYYLTLLGIEPCILSVPCK
ncbi:hypothetical protein OUZ56_020964 [Daphnia magna]|uniref:Uncharacterized protein n=1 Tax=Daphnia magna TaxID=35525 RepID=A0ABQ9ZG02_9CRUS|nr:hypothetical protein OUZ56_020964 [Daphnia magna]